MPVVVTIAVRTTVLASRIWAAIAPVVRDGAATNTQPGTGVALRR
jgi:hypothetical protein